MKELLISFYKLLIKPLCAMIYREMLLTLRHKSEVFTVLFFFIIVTSLFPLGIGPETATLKRIAPGVIWVCALLATMLSLQRMFTIDYLDGTLEQMLISPTPLVVLVLGKIIASFLLSGLPLVLLSPLIGLQFGLSSDVIFEMMITLILGTPILALIGSVGAALTLGLRGSGVLLSILILPLYIPVLIFGAGAIEAYTNAIDNQGHLSLLTAMLFFSLLLCPWATATALRISIE